VKPHLHSVQPGVGSSQQFTASADFRPNKTLATAAAMPVIARIAALRDGLGVTSDLLFDAKKSVKRSTRRAIANLLAGIHSPATFYPHQSLFRQDCYVNGMLSITGNQK
jgi:hypothetical protein